MSSFLRYKTPPVAQSQALLTTKAGWVIVREPLNNSSLNYSETKKKKCDFSFSHIFNNLQFLKMAAHPCAAGRSE